MTTKTNDLTQQRKTKDKRTAGELPSETDILDFIQNEPGRVGKREIARAFQIKGAQRVELKRLLKDMTERGLLARESKQLRDPTVLPPVTVLEVSGTDSDGELIAVPSNWDADEHGPPPAIVVETPKTRGKREESRPPGEGDRILARLTATATGPDGRPSAYEARVIRKLADAARRVLGLFHQTKGQGMRIVPVDKKGAKELAVLPGDEAGAKSGELVSAEIVKDRGRGLVRARIRERLGRVDDQRNISLVAIHQRGIPDHFPDEVTEAADRLAPLDLAGRTDMRDTPLVTIDPPDARDHDDAVWAEPDDAGDNEGGFRVVVAIADVAAYVHPGSVLDREARRRGNSVYFPDRVVPMLPEKLSADLCSLREGEDRPALACIMRFDKAGTKLDHRFERIVMRSAAGLSYEQAQAAIDGRTDDKTGPLLDPVLKPLWAAYRALSAARKRRGPLELDIPERKLVLDAHGLIERVVTPERLDAHKLIEEMMIQANVAAAETLEKARVPLIYRVHDAPSDEKAAALSEFLRTIGLSLAKGQTLKPQHFNKILEAVRGREYEHLVNEVVLRTQAQAIYTPENGGHFGLNLRRYAHFTSPIRRYADLIVHRALITAHGFGKDGLSEEDIARLEETAETISDAERRAMAAERDTVDRLVARHLADKVGSVFKGRIAGVTRAGLFITLDDTGADGFVPMGSLIQDFFVYDEAGHALVGRHTGETYRLGDRVEVRLVEVTPIAGGIRMEMLSDGHKSAKPAKSARPAKTAKSRKRDKAAKPRGRGTARGRKSKAKA
ncbi:ribonuclease R [Kaustia mangrovi]|uniref:Ribonuclease R n=1 Tax=Kaustia mangrovi TaxID=2593653 RepID=A0A7S8C804_9HYPH|nr:ribonuclease R [Kaustia mangrovi]